MAPNGDGIQPLLDRFEAETGVHVRLRCLAWDAAFSLFVRSALYSDSPDVSELGTTWVGDLIGMNALRPFHTAEIAALGKPGAFLPQAWRSAAYYTAGLPNERVWSIPWLAGVRMVYYRKAVLERAGVDPDEAFSSNARLAATVRRLAETGVRVPWTVPTGYTHTTLHNISAWIWGAGGDFLAPDHRRMTLLEAPALEGMCDYFSLGRYLAPEVRGLNGLEPDDYLLRHAETGATISGPWLFAFLPPEQREPLGVTLPPGPSFVGGSNLVIWKSARNPEAAFKLIHFLTQNPAQVRYAQTIGLLPARQSAAEAEPFASDPNWQMALRGLNQGRSYPTIRLWGLIEDRLAAAFHAVWVELLANPGTGPRAALLEHLEPLVERMDELLGRE